MEGVPPDFTDVERHAGHLVGDILLARLDHQVGLRHLAPVFGLDEEGGEAGRQRRKRVHHEVVGADVGAVPVVLVGEEDRARPVRREDPGDGPDHALPMGRVFGAALGRDLLQSVGRGLDQPEAEIAAGFLELRETAGLAGAVAALGDGDVDHVPCGLAAQPERQVADEALVVGVRGEDERGRSAGADERVGGGRETAERKGFAVAELAGVGGDKARVRIHRCVVGCANPGTGSASSFPRPSPDAAPCEGGGRVIVGVRRPACR